MNVIEWLRSIEERFDRGISREESVVFYPSYGFRDAGGWKLQVRGTISEQRKALRKAPQVALTLAGVPSAGKLTELMGDLAGDVDALQIFKDRTAPFLVDAESHERFEVKIRDRAFEIGPSSSVGYVDSELDLPPGLVDAVTSGGSDPWVPFTAADNDLERFFTGRSRLTSPHGVTVVSDIDDTIKDSNVPEPVQLILNTLFRPFKVIPGMAEVYQGWSGLGAGFVYLTNSPYQLFEPLHAYLLKLYPEGAYYMRLVDWRAVTSSIDQLVAADEHVGARENPKKYNLIPILERFPERRFILVGDSTERDAEIYADLFVGENFPDAFPSRPYDDRIARVYVRDRDNTRRRAEAEASVARINAARAGTAILFTDPAVIADDACSVFDA